MSLLSLISVHGVIIHVTGVWAKVAAVCLSHVTPAAWSPAAAIYMYSAVCGTFSIIHTAGVLWAVKNPLQGFVT